MTNLAKFTRNWYCYLPSKRELGGWEIGDRHFSLYTFSNFEF